MHPLVQTPQLLCASGPIKPGDAIDYVHPADDSEQARHTHSVWHHIHVKCMCVL